MPQLINTVQYSRTRHTDWGSWFDDQTSFRLGNCLAIPVPATALIKPYQSLFPNLFHWCRAASESFPPMSSCIRIFSTDVEPYQNLFQVPLQFTPTLSPGQHAACKTHSTHFCNFWAPEVPTFLWKGLCSWSGALIRKFIGTCKLRYFLKAVCTKWSLNGDPSRISAVGTIREQVDIFVIGSNRVQGEEWHSVREKDDDNVHKLHVQLGWGVVRFWVENKSGEKF